MKQFIYEKDTSWTCPPGVKRVRVHGYEHDHNVLSSGVVGQLIDRSGLVYSWGANLSGQVGDASVVPKSSPVLVSGSLIAKEVATTGFTSHLITDKGVLYGWGLAVSLGMIGDNSVVDKSSPVLVLGGYVDLVAKRTVGWKKVSTGRGNVDTHGLALNYAGNVYHWGQNTYGQRGTSANVGTTFNYPSQVIPFGAIKIKDISAGQECSFFIDQDDNGWACGRNNLGQLGDGTTVDKSSPVLISGNLKWKAINDQFGITLDGTAYCWGANTESEIGDGAGTNLNKSSPVLVTGVPKFTRIASVGDGGGGHTRFGVDITGQVWIWGGNASSVFANIVATQMSAPFVIASAKKFVMVGGQTASGLNAGAAIMSETDGNIYGYGANANGQVGDGTVITKNTSPVQVLLGRRTMQDLAVPKVLLDVVPGQSYSVVINAYFASFGGTPIGRLLKGIVIEY